MHIPLPESPWAHEAREIIECAWAELQRSPYVQTRLGVAPTQLPEVSFSEAERRSRVGQSILKRMDVLPLSPLPHDLELTLRVVRFHARTWSFAAQWYWIAVDPLGIGEFGLFLPTAYCGGYLLSFVHRQLTSVVCAQPPEPDRYLALLADYARIINQFAQRTAGQAQRGIRIPKVQVTQARSLLTTLKSGVWAQLALPIRHAASLWPGNTIGQVEHCIASHIVPAFDRAIADLSDVYLEQAPDTVGMGQYPGGEAVYAELVKLHTTLDLTPEQVQARGFERMAEIEESIGVIQTELGFKGDTTGFLAHLNDDPTWRADTVSDVTAIFQRYIDRLKPHFDELFPLSPKTGYGVAPLPAALGSMTYGYYDPPNETRDQGLYLFNAANLTKRPLFHLGAITYHELLPGHHLQFALQQQNTGLHPVRVHSFVTAYIEGWAEYAATLAGEIGLYETPPERYGRLLMEAFLTSRLVVDTGMNVLGWSLDRGRQWMRSHSRLTEAEVLKESLRYSCDIPAQSLAYKFGDAHILKLRARMRAAYGARFQIKEFHRAVLEVGVLPLPDLEWHVEHVIEQYNRRSAV